MTLVVGWLRGLWGLLNEPLARTGPKTKDRHYNAVIVGRGQGGGSVMIRRLLITLPIVGFLAIVTSILGDTPSPPVPLDTVHAVEFSFIDSKPATPHPRPPFRANRWDQ